MVKTIDFLASDDEEQQYKSSTTLSKTKSTFNHRTDDDQEEDVDIFSSLIPQSKPTSLLKRKTNNASISQQQQQQPSKPRNQNNNNDDDDEDDATFIAQFMQQQNKKAGTEVAKKTMAGKNKGKNKLASGIATGGGSFQSMGLHPSLLRSLLLRGFTTPTPIQRQAIPAILSQPPQDVVGMARTGSGKTLAYLIPLIQRLNGRHSRMFGIKSLILCPSRELALQILRVGKELARGWKSDPGEGQDSKGEAIRWAMIVGGEGMDEQFGLMASNPDIVIATPGRLLHLTVEMNLDLKSVEYVVFDEADRLFEMGFAEQLEELLLRLPPTRQTLLFSATLPKRLVEFAKAGLQENPKLVRLDADSKISSELRMAFFSVKPSEKEASLLVLLRDVIGVPFGEQADIDEEEERRLDRDQYSDNENDKGNAQWGRKRSNNGKFGAGKGDSMAGKKRKRHAVVTGADQLLPHQTIIFAATKHHVEYLLLLLTTAGYACSHIYSSLDQATRSIQMARFRRGQTSLLIVTDVAARGIDLPVLEHVVNFDFPPQSRTFIHRVGRTARAGRTGWAWSFCTNAELPYLCDLQLFLARPLVSSHMEIDSEIDLQELEPIDLHEKLVLGTLPREALDLETEFIRSGLTNTSSSTIHDFPNLQQVVERAQAKYERSIAKASQESHRRAKEMIKAGAMDMISRSTNDRGIPTWALAGSPVEELAVHDVIQRPHVYGLQPITNNQNPDHPVGGLPKGSEDLHRSDQKKDLAKDVQQAAARAALLAKVNSFRPGETVFEIGARGENTELGKLMKSRRKTLQDKSRKIERIKARKRETLEVEPDTTGSFGKKEKKKVSTLNVEEEDDEKANGDLVELEEADENDIQNVFDTGSKHSRRTRLDLNDEVEVEDEMAAVVVEKHQESSKRNKPTVKTQPTSFRDASIYLDYEQKGAQSEKGYAIGSSSSFLQQARQVTFDLTGDDSTLGTQIQKPNAARWDTKKKKFIQGDGTGSDNKKMIRTESGLRLPASFRSGRFEQWKREQRVDLPKVGETEVGNRWATTVAGRGGGSSGGGDGYRHTKFTAPKPLDPLANNYAKKLKHRKQMTQEAAFASSLGKPGAGAGAGNGFGEKKSWKERKVNTGERARNEIKSAREIQKTRELKEKRREKNARPSTKGKSKGKGKKR